MRHATLGWFLGAFVLLACSGDPTGVVVTGERVFDDHSEIDLRFRSGEASLEGTLFLPPGSGPVPAVVLNEGSSWTVRSGWADVGPYVGVLGAVLTFDRRGSGSSTGECCELPDDELFPLLASDAAAAARALLDVDGVDPGRIGLLGTSFSGWTVPLAASMDRDAVSFLIVAVGGAVSVGQEMAYDRITGYDRCSPTGISAEAASDSIESLGSSGWDPLPSLRQLVQPALWLFGGNDLSHPTHLSVRNLEAVANDMTKDWDVHVFENANHDLILEGTICQTEGPVADVIPVFQAFVAGLD